MIKDSVTEEVGKGLTPDSPYTPVSKYTEQEQRLCGTYFHKAPRAALDLKGMGIISAADCTLCQSGPSCNRNKR